MVDIKQCEDFFPSEDHAFCVFILSNQAMADLHGHEFDELVIVRSGSGFHIVNDHAEMIRPGDFFFVTANDVHYYEATSELSLINILIHRQRPFQYIKNIDALIESISEKTRPFDDRYQPLTERTLNSIITLAEGISRRRDDAFDPLYFSGTESAFLQILTLLCTEQTVSKSAVVDERRKIYLLDHIRQHYAQEINWKGVCEEGGIALRTLYRFFREMTGNTPEKFQQLYRLLKAQELLRTTDIPVSRIALLCGFLNPPRLTEAYRRYFQHTPSQERQLSTSIKQKP
ncbi:helix-turn-helix domain-containing protein [Scandinavium goeteborgense]|uniref:helix-turn-helix domain-containing protein n=1 Tax=Scandinavium goeteborgense TaxID=1851514 RepID=UPI000F67676E|nr:helix-turn-helix domain-containing protein [Scandinavium goeteborgense]QKN80964.1 helix-turn-helix domain-containing protein [Scandinavium goeteborgense]